MGEYVETLRASDNLHTGLLQNKIVFRKYSLGATIILLDYGIEAKYCDNTPYCEFYGVWSVLGSYIAPCCRKGLPSVGGGRGGWNGLLDYRPNHMFCPIYSTYLTVI